MIAIQAREVRAAIDDRAAAEHYPIARRFFHQFLARQSIDDRTHTVRMTLRTLEQ
jgi:hypothetical protein